MPRPPRHTVSSRTGSPATARPSAARSAAGPVGAAGDRRPPGELRAALSVRRLAILGAIFVMLAVTLLPTLRSTLSQRSQINDLHDQVAQQGETVAALQQEQRSWSDPAYVEQQARERLKLVRVGETSYTVIDAEATLSDAGGPRIAAPDRAATADSPWYGRLWSSMVIADTPSNMPSTAR